MITLFATCPKGLEEPLASELRALGARSVRPVRAGVAFAGNLPLAYRACLWSRLASRVLLPLARFEAASAEALYAGVRAIEWEAQLRPEDTLAVDARVARSAISHSRYAALRVKDAVVDRFRDRCGARPSVDTERPSVRLNLHLQDDRATLAVDLGGGSLHRRGYRLEGGCAPLRENLAAGVLALAGWPAIAREGGALVDPLCGSGTLVVEGALMAADIAPGLVRLERGGAFGFLGWRGHDANAWRALLAEARARRAAGLARLGATPDSTPDSTPDPALGPALGPVVLGYDHEPAAVATARANLARAGLAAHVPIERRALADHKADHKAKPPAASGLVVANPPYGERLGDWAALGAVHAQLERALAGPFKDFHAALLLADERLAGHLAAAPRRCHELRNGALRCRLLVFAPRAGAETPRRRTAPPPGANRTVFANRLRKNLRHRLRWAARENVTCFRAYDGDVPEYRLAVDVYGAIRPGGEPERWAHVLAYAPPPGVDPVLAHDRLEGALETIAEVLELPPARIVTKVRRRRRGGTLDLGGKARGELIEVREGAWRFLVNLTGRLDTGLFLDQRPTRRLVAELARGRRFLNLFGYTGTATVAAASGGARATTTVDLSHTYLEWGRRNLALNGLESTGHAFVRADVRRFLEQAHGERYGLILLDPPTFSRSKAMAGTLDVQRDHPDLIRRAAARLEPDGVLLFSTNARRFELERAALAGLSIDDMTARTVPPDFARTPQVHRAYRITRRRN